MSFYRNIKKALTDTVDAVIDKTATQAQKNRLRLVMRNESEIINNAYIELGKYFYNNLRDGASPEQSDLCDKIENARQRMSRAQERYRDVLQEEMINKEISRGEAKENFRNLKEPVVEKAKQTADKVSEIKDAAVEKASVTASDIKTKIPKPKHKYSVVYTEVTDLDEKNDNGAENDPDFKTAEEIFDNAVEDAIETVIASDGDITVQEAVENAVAKIVRESVKDEIEQRQAAKETTAEIKKAEESTAEPEIEIEVTATPVYDDADGEEDEEEEYTADVTPQQIYGVEVEIFEEKSSPAIPTGALPENKSPKKHGRPSAVTKAKKLKNIIAEQENADDEAATEPNE